MGDFLIINIEFFENVLFIRQLHASVINFNMQFMFNT